MAAAGVNVNQQGASYIIGKDDTTYYAVRCSDGVIVSTNADAKTVIQAAIDAIASVGGEIRIKRGTYALATALSLSDKKAVLRGEGYTTILQRTGAVVDITNTTTALGHQQGLCDITLDAVDNSAVALSLTKVDHCMFENLSILKGSIGLYMAKSLDNTFVNLFVYSSGTGVKIDDVRALPMCNANFFFGGQIETCTSVGVHLRGVQTGNLFYGTTIQNSTTNQVLIESFSDGGYEVAPDSCIFDGCYFEGSAGPYINFTTGGTWYARGIEFRGCNFSVAGSITIIDLKGSRCVFTENNLCAAETQAFTLTYNVQGSQNIISDCFVNRGEGTSGTVAWVITGNNNLFENIQGVAAKMTWSDAGSGNRFENCTSRLQWKEGVTVISSGGTYVEVTHSLYTTPTMVLVSGNQAETAQVYADNIGATTFRATVPSAVTADRAVYWRARVVT